MKSHGTNEKLFTFFLTIGVGGLQVCSMKEDQFSLVDYLANHADEAKNFPNFPVDEAVKHNFKANLSSDFNSSSCFSLNSKKPSEAVSQQRLLNNSKFNLDFENNSFNNKLLEIYRNQVLAKIRKEQFLPPIRFWTKQFLICKGILEIFPAFF